MKGAAIPSGIRIYPVKFIDLFRIMANFLTS
jgi:hypothetical protein